MDKPDNVIYLEDAQSLYANWKERIDGLPHCCYMNWETDPMGLMQFWHRSQFGVAAAIALSFIAEVVSNVACSLLDLSDMLSDVSIEMYQSSEDLI